MTDIQGKAEWSAAEKWAWGRIAEGEQADFSRAQGELDPRSDEGWTGRRTLRSSFLRTILFDKEWVDRIPVDGVRIAGARWAGPVVLNHATVDRPLVLDRCRFEGQVDLSGCRFEWRLSFQRSAFCASEGGPSLIFEQVRAARGDFGGSYFRNGAAGNDSIFTAALDFNGAELAGKLELKGAKVGSLMLRDAVTGDLEFTEIESDRNVNLRRATVAGTLDLTSCMVGQDLELAAGKAKPATFEKDVLLLNAVVKGGVTFVGASVRGQLNMNGLDVQRQLHLRSPLETDDEKGTSVFEKKVDLTAARIAGGLDMTGARFNGPVILNSARLGATAHLMRCYFGEELNFASLHVEGSIHLDSVVIRKTLKLSNAQITEHLNLRRGGRDGDPPACFHGGVSLSHASVGGLLDLKGATFEKALDLGHIEVKRDVKLDATVEGALNLSSGDIGGTLTLSTTTHSEVDMSNLHVGQDLHLSGKYQSGVKLRQARIDRMLDVKAEAEIEMLDLSGAAIGGEARIPLPRPAATPADERLRLDLSDAKAGSLHVRSHPPGNALPSAWPESGSVHLDGFTVGRLSGYGATAAEEMTSKPVCWFRNWLALDEPYAPQPYEHMAAVLHQAGQSEKANWILWYGRERAREASTWLRWIGLSLLKYGIGYGIGFRYFFALGWAALFTAIGVLVLEVSGGVKHEQLLEPLSQKLVYSFDQLLPIIELNGAFSTISPKGFSEGYFYFHRLVGFLLGTFIAAGVAGLTQRSRG